MSLHVSAYSNLSPTTEPSDSLTLKKQLNTDFNKFEKDKKSAKSKVKAIEKKLNFSNLIHHADSDLKVHQYVHAKHQEARTNNKTPFQVDHKKLGIDVKPYNPETQYDLKYEVIGWYPHWEKDYYKSINYSLLTTVAYFSYLVNPATGEAKSEYDWESTPLIDSLLNNDKRALLTLSNFGEANNETLLKNDDAVKLLISETIDLIEQREAHGVCVDFEGIGKAQAEQFSSFITRLSQELRRKNKSYLLYITLPSVNWAKCYEFDILIPLVDRFVIMGYGYYDGSSDVAGPVAGLLSGKEWEPFNLSLSVDYYLASEIPSSKLILALPTYGAIWNTESAEKLSKPVSYQGARSLDYIKANISSKTQYDSISQSAWTAYAVDSGKTKFRQCWFDDDSTYSVKLNYIKSKKLAGMGIWALGYDKGFPTIWGAIAANMCDTILRPGVGVVPVQVDTAGQDTAKVTIWDKLTGVENALKEITNYKTVLLFTMTSIVIFGGLGFLIAMFKPETRMFFFGSNAYTVYYTAFVLIFLIIILRWTNIANNGTLALLTGFLGGGVAVFYVKRVLDRINRDKP